MILQNMKVYIYIDVSNIRYACRWSSGYLASDMLECAAKATEPIHIILLTCDGDYAEAIKTVLRLRPGSRVTVMATPMTRQNNCLSVRLRQLTRELSTQEYYLANISAARDYISYTGQYERRSNSIKH